MNCLTIATIQALRRRIEKIINYVFESLTPSSCGHSPYLIYDESRERIESITLTVFTPSELYGDSPPPLCFAQQNIEAVARSDGGVKIQRQQQNQVPILSPCVPTRNIGGVPAGRGG